MRQGTVLRLLIQKILNKETENRPLSLFFIRYDRSVFLR